MEYKLFIDGKWVRSSSGKTFKSTNPANGQAIGNFQLANEKDVDLAVAAADRAFDKWSETPPPARGQILLRAAQLLKKEKERLAKLVTMEMGKVLSEGRGDVQEAIDIAEYMAGEGRRLFGHTTTSELRNKFAMTVRRPVGVFALITPWNFPIAIPAWKMVTALICGNTVVFKPSSDTPLCAVELVKIFQKAGVPPGVLNLITGPGETVGNYLVRHKKVDGISFTGSKAAGEFILKNAGVKKVGLELGGKNAIIIMDDADLDLAVDGAIWGGFGTSGQRCTAASRIILHKNIKKKFEQVFVSQAKKLKIGDGLKGADIGPLVNRAALEKVQKYVEIGKREGAKLLCGGKSRGLFYEPTVFTDVKPAMRIAQEEIFGPVVSLLEAADFEDAIRIHNSTEYGLSSAIYTANISRAFKAVEKIKAGLTYINSPTIGAEVHLPFGGVKGSGTAREAGIEGILEFSETKTVYFDYSGRLQKAQISEEEW